MIFGNIRNYLEYEPQLHDEVFVSEGAFVIGRVFIKEKSSVWYNAVLRADVGEIRIGKYTNVQDGSIIHVNFDGLTDIGDYVTIGHGVIIHNAKIGFNSLIGNGAILLDDCEIGSNVVVAAGTVIPPRKKIPDNVLVMGNPYRIVRDVTEDEIAYNQKSGNLYWKFANDYSVSNGN